MEELKTRAIKGLEKKMEAMDRDSYRFHVLETAKSFKSSWVELGRSLYSVCRDKLYREWGYNTIEVYAQKEIGLKKDTVLKLLRSYYFLEKEEPTLLRQNYTQDGKPVEMPTYEAVDVLRRAKAKKGIGEEDYNSLRKKVFEQGKDSREVRKDLTAMIRQREELLPEEAREKKRSATIRRFLGTLKALKQEIELSKLAPAAIIRDAASLIKKLEEEINK